MGKVNTIEDVVKMDYSLRRKIKELRLDKLGVKTALEKAHQATACLPNISDNSRMKLLETKIAGTTFIENKSHLKDLRIGERIYLKREPTNQYDPMAIGIYTSDKMKLGYVPKDENTVIGNLLDAEKHLSANVLDVVDQDRYFDIYIEICLDEE